MSFLGLHWIDAAILAIYVVGVLAVGQYLSSRIKSGNDYFLAGRSLGKLFQFFLNFGNMTDPSGAAVTASSVYRQGVGGVWLGLIPLFLTPYYWFMCVWFRRVRLTTIADLFEDRFGKRFLASLYAVVNLSVAILVIGFGNIVAYKTLAPIMAKDEAIYSAAEKQQVADYYEFTKLRKTLQTGTLTQAEVVRYDMLKGLYNRGELHSYISYLAPVPFYIASSILVAVFIMLGGLKASAMVDALQALLVIIISVILVPFGLYNIGGFGALHAKVPNYMFEIFGGSLASEYTSYSIAAFFLVSFIGINAAQANMSIAGSAKNEIAARIGAVTGGFSKRIMTIAWCFCGLLAVAVFGPNLSDSDQVWGLLTRTLLPVGLIGVMIIGILGGKLAHLGASSVVLSALVVKNLYMPVFPGKSERHYMVVARVAVPVVLTLGVLVALYMYSAIAVMKFIIVMGVIWGAPIMLIYTWRRLTEMAVRIQVILCLLIIGIVPWIVSATPALRQSPALTLMNQSRQELVVTKATDSDVELGLAKVRGERMEKQIHIEPVSLFFEDGIARADPTDLNSPREGVGRFNIEIYMMSLLGLDVTRFSAAMLLTTRYLVDALMPLLMLIVFSLLTKPAEAGRVARFYAKLKTPVGATPQEDAREVELSFADTTRFDHAKIFPKSNWEFTKWSKLDVLGFLGCCAAVVVVLLVFKGVLMIGGL